MVSSHRDASAHPYANESATRMVEQPDLRTVASADLRVRTTTVTALPLTHARCEHAATTDAWFDYLSASQRIPAHRIIYSTFIKRAIDIVGAVLLLVVFSPVLLIVALTIRISQGGPIFYRQQRIGRYGQPFTMLKFTSMIPDRRNLADEWDGIERRITHKTRKDPRVTRVGRLIRALSIDELPQLINILRGDMSLIGPRPELLVIVGRYAPWQHQRHLVRPGLTGWWQVEGRSDRPMHEHTELDLYYIEHLSLALDLRILLRTFRAVLSRSGAF